MRRALKWWLPDSDTHFEEFLKVYASDRMQMCERVIQRWDVAVDVGAHVGFWTCWMMEKFKYVHAFEPDSENYECLRANIEGENITTYPWALGNKAGMVGMKRANETNSGAKYIVEGDGTKMVRLDSFGLPTLSFIKIDTEGYEGEILEGGEQTIRRCKPVVCIEKALKKRSETDSFKLLQDWGMEQKGRIKQDYVFGW